ncbi:23S rRNA (uracil(1939)-C(5))-methyltransferase RlmD [Estrella lausannensis]|uniref:23S rRNA (Uracil-5-)-methyltransferase n=1 Tax=Estrella lausannensis TaxID=483423 RepID=A0A0H5DSV8_9BACT|nr:23S rRNA (uracil(1939)-C(5))-methyltransferase RlmD [Estrella lausannensis]CRX39418.1 23S rRNA (uracil-5-)-methyltransferase [Estrella lausannensis]
MTDPQESHLLSVRSLGHRGEGVGVQSQLVMFVDGALPQEIVEVEVTAQRKRFAEAKLLKVVQQSPDRIAPPCPLFGSCGGCQIQHLSYPGQLKAKQERVKECLTRIGKFTDVHVEECIPSPDPFHWRHKVQMPAAAVDGKLVFGFYEKRTHTIVPVSTCLIHCDEGDKAMQALEEEANLLQITPYSETTGQGALRHILLKTSLSSKKTMAVFITNGREKGKMEKLAKRLMEKRPDVAGVFLSINKESGNTILGNSFELLAGASTIQEELLGLRFTVSPASFFQVNPAQAENMYRKTLEFAAPTNTTRVLDCYSGVGTMSLIMARQAGFVKGIEWVEAAVEDAYENSRLNAIANIEFKAGAVESISFRGESFDTVLLNPPRKGCDEKALKAILNLAPATIVYTSCDPATLSRDLAALQAGGYRIEKVQPFDMFPQTMHVETVVKLSRL